MAGDWIKWESGLEAKPEIFRIAKALRVSRFDACGRCMLFWVWADGNTTDGFIKGADAAFVDEIVGVVGFADALECAGWIVVDDMGVTLINFDRHNGKTAKQRALANRRKIAWRGKNGTAPAFQKERT